LRRANPSETLSATLGRLSSVKPLLTALLMTMLCGCNSEVQLPAPAPKEIGGVTPSRDRTSEVRPNYPSPEFPELVAESDTIIVGTIGHGVAVPSDQPAAVPVWLSTDYHVAVQRVVRQGAVHAFASGDTAIVRRLGGATTREGAKITLTEVGFPPFNAGETYVLFLASLPNKTYLTLRYGPQNAFLITSENNVEQVAPRHFGRWNPERRVVSLEAFLDEVQRILATSR
jgi:hypothetical protein